MREWTIPVLPCISLPETLAFYRVLGFESTYEQHRPYVYGAVKRGDVDVHFMGGFKKLEPKEAFSTCLVMVAEVEALHASFAAALREEYERLPVAGIPRITRMKPGQSRFTIVDPNGNSLVFIKQGAAEEDETAQEAITPKEGESKLMRALRLAARLRDFKNDDAAAAKVLDTALGREDRGEPGERARVLAARIELAVALGDAGRVPLLRGEIDGLPLSGEERDGLAAELERGRSLERVR